MSTQQTRSGGGGGGGRTQKKSNSAHIGGSGGGGGGGNNDLGTITHAATVHKKTDANKTEKPEKAQPKATTEQLRIAQITNSTTEDPQINEKVTLLLTMTQRSEEEVCCALNECDYDIEAAANFLIEILPQGAFAKYEKKRKNKAANAVADGAGGDADWADGNANADRREKSRNRSANRGGRGGTDSRGWRGREARENDRNMRESRGGDRGEDRANDNYRGQRNGGRGGPGGPGSGGGGGRDGGRGGGFMSRPGRGGGRMGGRSGGPRGDRGYGIRNNANNEDHHEVELWDNTIAQNAEKQQQQQAHDDAWGDWNNEEYEGSLKDSKVFTTSNLNTQTAASVVSGAAPTAGTDQLSAPPGLEHHQQQQLTGQGSHLGALVGSSEDNNSSSSAPSAAAVVGSSATTPMMQYSAAVSNPPPQLQSVGSSTPSSVAGSSPYVSNAAAAAVDTFSSAASAAATLVQQAQQLQQQQQQQQQQTPLKPSATLSAEQSQYFNSLTSQGASPTAAAAAVAAQPSMAAVYGSQSNSSTGPYANTYANVFASAPGSNIGGTPNSNSGEQSQQPQVRRARVKLPPPSKIPASAVEMPGDNALNNIGYLDVQFGAMDFGTDDSFDALPEKFNAGVSIDGQQQQQQDDYQTKSQQQQQALSAGLQNAQILQGDALSAAGYATRSTGQQQSGNALDQLTKNDPYGQAGSGNNNGATSYQNAYQSSAASKANSAYQTSAGVVQGYNSSSYANVQSNSYQPSSYGSYQANAVNSYQQQQQQQQQQAASGAQNATGSSGAAVQNIPISGSGNQNSSSVSTSSGVSSSSASTGNGAAGVGSGATGANQTVVSNTNNNVSGSSSASSVTAGVNSNSSNVVAVSSQGGSSIAGVSVSGGVSGVNAGGSASSVGVGVGNNAASVQAQVAQTTAGTAAAVLATLTNKNSSSSNSSGAGGNGSSGVTGSGGAVGVGVGSSAGSTVGAGGVGSGSSSTGAGGAGGAGGGSGGGSSGGGGGSSGLVPTNIQMVSQYIQTGLPYYQQPVYSYEELQMMQQRVPHVQGYYDLNYTPTSLGAGRDNLGSVAYSTMTDGRFARTDNNSSPVSNVSSTMSQQAGSSAPMLNVPYAYFYGGNVMPGGFQYGTPAIYPQQIPAANTASGGQFPKPSYSAGYGSTSYDALSQTTQDYSKGGYSSSVNQQSKTQTVSNQPQAGTGSDLTSSMYGKGHVALNKVNSYEKQSFHSGTPPPFNMANTQTAGGTSAQPYGMYLPMPAAGHHNMIHPPIHQDSNSAGQRQQSSSQSKSTGKPSYPNSYWTGQN
ncbi:PREDICTED: protein lingerer isoform X9 [Drosophila arizonae]|uniref:Protein lingerer isoform X9 n=1 Tax=Drosophila arizonae TaxID=7263 RepID=A0ABM1PDB6_DROAR|nr:PREDICTED: protein lingerer isoform X9 [Drosophila arizonae]